MKNQAEICSFSEQFWVPPRRAAFRRADGAPESGSTRARLNAASAFDQGIESRSA